MADEKGVGDASELSRWSGLSASTAATETIDWEKVRCDRPPIPPIPGSSVDKEWRRSGKRQSSASALSGRTEVTTRTLGADLEKAESRPVSGVSMASFDTGPKKPRPVSCMSTASTGGGMKKPRPVSGVSTNSMKRTESQRFSLHDLNSAQREELAMDTAWEIDPQNARNWTKAARVYHTFLAIGIAFTCALASSITALAHGSIKDHTQASSTVALLPYALFFLGLASGPVISSSCEDVFGRKVIYLVCMSVFALFTLASGLVNTTTGLIVCRFFAGVFASAGLAMGPAMLRDIWTPAERAIPMALYSTMLLLGPAIGMLFSGFVTEGKDWRWTQYTVLFVFIAFTGPAVGMRETCKHAILKRRATDLGVDNTREKTRPNTPDPFFSTTKAREIATSVFRRPLQTLLTEPTAGFYSLYVAFNFAVMYASFTALPPVLNNVYHSSLGSQGLAFISLAIGVVVGFVLLMLNENFLYLPRVARWEAEQAAQAEQAQAGRRACRSSRPVHRSASQSRGASRPRLPREGSRTSLVPSLKRKSPSTSRDAPRPATPPERNINLAVAAATYLNGVPENTGKRIMPERILLLLMSHPSYNDLCAALEGYSLKFDRNTLAKLLVEALPNGSSITEPPNFARSKSLHRNAAAAALTATPSPAPQSNLSPCATLRTLLESTTPKDAPAEWRLHIALPASILIPVALFLFAWTARPSVHWIAPAIALAIFGGSSLLVFVSAQAYFLEFYGPTLGPCALAGEFMLRYALSFAFALFALPMYHNLGMAWATSVFAFISVALGLVPWILLLVRPTLTQK